jgi:NAD(P)-dependent dehydrogenase (short-subunit alcohol dehydrogenase family)
MSSPRTIVVFGSGPGIGRSVAQEFAANGFNHIILLARHHANLHQDKLAIEKISTNIKIDTITVNLADKASLKEALAKIDSLAKEIEFVLYNGARVAPSTLLEFPVEEMELDFKVHNSIPSHPIPSQPPKLTTSRQQTRDFISYRNGVSPNSRPSPNHLQIQSRHCSSQIVFYIKILFRLCSH